MKIVVIPVELKLGRGEREFILNIPRLATLRGLTWSSRAALVMSAGKPSFETVPVVHVELDPDDDKVDRVFMLLAFGEVLAPKDGCVARHCTWGSGIAPDGMARIGHVFEILEEN